MVGICYAAYYVIRMKFLLGVTLDDLFFYGHI